MLLRGGFLLNTVKKHILPKVLLPILFVYILFGAVSLYQGKEKIDERRHHIPVLKGMFEEGYINYIISDNYQAANTPLPYLPSLLISNLASIEPNIYIARSINFFISLLTLLLFILILNSIAGITDVRILIFLFYPYFIKTSFIFYPAIYGVFFLLLSIYLLGGYLKLKVLGAGIAASAGILSQQFILAFPVVYTMKFIFNKAKVINKNKLKSHILFYLPFIIPAALIWYWGGLTHKNFDFHKISFQLTNVTSVLTIIGGVTFFYFIDKLKSVNIKYYLVTLLLATVLVLFFSPVRMEYGGAGQIAGYTFNFLEKVSFLSVFLSKSLQIFLCSTGLYLFYQLHFEIKSNLQSILFYITIILALIYFFNTVLSERHLLPLIACILLLILPQIKSKWIIYIWVFFNIIFGTTFLAYALFIQHNLN